MLSRRRLSNPEKPGAVSLPDFSAGQYTPVEKFNQGTIIFEVVAGSVWKTGPGKAE